MQAVKNFNNILVFNPSFLGDSILTTPLLRALRAIFPESRISFCVRPENAPLFQNLEFIDDVVIFDKRHKDGGFLGAIKFGKRLKKQRFDLIVNLHLSVRSTFVLKALRHTYSVGFSEAALSTFFSRTIKRDMNLPEALRNLSILSLLCSDYTLDEAKLLGGGLACYIDPVLKENTRAYFDKTTLGKKIIGIAPGSVWRTKCWPAKYFASLASALYEKGYAIALFGSRADRECLQDFATYYKNPYYDFAEKTSLPELAAILANIDLLVVNDSGTMHVANAVGTHCVAIFGPTTKSLGFFPYDDKSVVVENNSVFCRPCGKHGGKSCPKKHFKCMMSITPDMVLASVLNYFNAGR